MRITIDDRKYKLNLEKAPNLQNLGQLIGFIMENFIQPGKVIVSLKLNGKEYNESSEYTMETNLSEIQSINIVTEEWSKLIKEAIISAHEYLDKIISAIQTVCDLFRKNKLVEANKLYSQCLEGINWYMTLIGSIDKNLTLSGQFPPLYDEELSEFSSLLEEILNAQKNADFILLSDLLEYELTECLKKFIKKLDEVEKGLRGKEDEKV